VAIYLGLDSSTQSLTATAIEVEGSHRSVLFERTLVFDTALPHYGTRHGVLPGTDPLVAFAPPLMWAEATARVSAPSRAPRSSMAACTSPTERAIDSRSSIPGCR
jgi:hypothetical protein